MSLPLQSRDLPPLTCTAALLLLLLLLLLLGYSSLSLAAGGRLGYGALSDVVGRRNTFLGFTLISIPL